MTHLNPAIVWSNDDQANVADMPELLGCTSHGDTNETALAAVKEAISLWIETAEATGRRVASETQ